MGGFEHRIGKYNGMSQIYLTLKHQRCIVLDGRQSIEFVLTRFAEGWKLVAVRYT